MYKWFMKTLHKLAVPWICWYVIFLHFAFAVLLWISPVVLHTSNLAPFASVDHNLQGIIFACAAILAAIGLTTKGTELWLLPQQSLLWIITINTMVYSWNGMYPDGTLRPGWFIFTDQLPMTFTTIFHALAISARHWVRTR